MKNLVCRLESKILMGRTPYERFFAKNLGTEKNPFIVELLFDNDGSEEANPIINYAAVSKDDLARLTPIDSDTSYLDLRDEEIRMFSYLDLLPFIGNIHLLIGEGEGFSDFLFVRPKKTDGCSLYGDYHSLIFDEDGVEEESVFNTCLLDLIFDDWLNTDFSSKSILTGEFPIRRELNRLQVIDTVNYYNQLRKKKFWQY
ncbi:MAG: hypothetical protein KC589_08730 [Nanoarchaeota archaeon]|nr:hypothetical protein [Nanoarchaeota archaeon]